MCHVRFDLPHDGGHHRCPQPHLIEPRQHLLGRRRLPHRRHLRPRTATQREMCRENLPAPVRHTTVRVHDARRELYQLPDVSDQQKIRRPIGHREVDRLADVVRHLDDRHPAEPQLLLDVALPVVPRHGQDPPRASANVSILHREHLPDRGFDGRDDRGLRHRLYDAGRPEDRDAALDPEHRIKGPLCELRARRHRNRDQIAGLLRSF